ncbi:MAG: sigma-70 family RNA polymerase sigma factor [Planctomycetota bacterium]|nr:sigma-70 family RNA polymerase sigma factor [Planctomycetota bacterium]
MNSFQDHGPEPKRDSANGSGCSADSQSSAPQAELIQQALEQFESPLIRYALRLTGNLDRARDVVQDTFLKLCRQPVDGFDGNLARWLFTVCRNGAFDLQRKERRMTTAAELSEQPSLMQESPESTAMTRDSAENVFRMLDQLPDNQQEVVRLKFQNDMTYQEIADATGLTVTNVGFLLHTALKRLRELLQSEQLLSAV